MLHSFILIWFILSCNISGEYWMCIFVWQVELYAVITAHGYDENFCGEFCVTSHHFLINRSVNNTLVFESAGE